MVSGCTSTNFYEKNGSPVRTCQILLYAHIRYTMYTRRTFFPGNTDKFVQLTLVISTSVVSNNRLSQRDNLIPVLT